MSSPGRTSQTIIKGADFALGIRRSENKVPCNISEDEYVAYLKNANGTLIASPIVQAIDEFTKRIFIPHSITATLAAGNAILEVWVTRTSDRFVYQLLLGKILIR